MNDNDIKVSVWCACYNHEKYIKQCLDGFINQKTNFKFEVIIHDDASTDKSAEIIKEYAEKYPNIIKPILQRENQLSKCIDLEKEFFVPNINGRYVAFCEGDDFWCNENKLQIQYNYMKQYGFLTCFHNTQVVNENGDIIKEKTYPSIIDNKILSVMGGNFQGKWMLYFLINAACFLHVSSFMLDAQEFIKYVTDTPEFAKDLKNVGIGDGPLIAYFASLEKTCYLPIFMSCYRNSHEGSFTRELQKDRSKFYKVIDAWKSMYYKFNEFTNNKYEDVIIQKNLIK